MRPLNTLGLFIFINCSIAILHAQTPQAFNYQAVSRNSAGQPLVNSSVAIRVSIHDSTALGTVLYAERDTATTNQFGLFNTMIGRGNVISGVFNTINWGLHYKFIEIELDPTGGSNYTNLGTTQLLSVPYALHSNTSWIADTVLHIPATANTDTSILTIYDFLLGQNITGGSGYTMNWTVGGLSQPHCEIDSDYTFNNDTFIINKPGKYRVAYEVSLVNSAGGTTGNSAGIWIWQSPGVIMNGTYSGIYLGTTANAIGTASRSAVFAFMGGEAFWVQVTQITGDGTMQTVPHGSQFRIERIGN